MYGQPSHQRQQAGDCYRLRERRWHRAILLEREKRRTELLRLARQVLVLATVLPVVGVALLLDETQLVDLIELLADLI